MEGLALPGLAGFDKAIWQVKGLSHRLVTFLMRFRLLLEPELVFECGKL
jgi:hypothetical protein